MRPLLEQGEMLPGGQEPAVQDDTLSTAGGAQAQLVDAGPQGALCELHPEPWAGGRGAFPGKLGACGHAVQGDGEVCLTAIETAMSGTFQIHVRKDLSLRYPMAETSTHMITMGMDPDLDNAAKQALREMIALLGERAGLSPEDAYSLCSIAAELRVTQLVDGHKGIHAMMPKSLVSPQPYC